MKYNINLEIKPSPLHGLGVFATRDIPKGRSLHQGHFFQDGIQIRSSYVGFYNYSENPNCELKVKQEVLNKKFFAFLNQCWYPIMHTISHLLLGLFWKVQVETN